MVELEGIGGPVVLFEHHSKSDVVDQLKNALRAFRVYLA